MKITLSVNIMLSGVCNVELLDSHGNVKFSPDENVNVAVHYRAEYSRGVDRAASKIFADHAKDQVVALLLSRVAKDAQERSAAAGAELTGFDSGTKDDEGSNEPN